MYQHERRNGFPDRSRIESAIVAVLKEHGGRVAIKSIGGRSIYEILAARLGVSDEAAGRPTPGTGEAAWRPEVGFARQNLVEAGILKPTIISRRGIWELAERPASSK